MKNNTFNPVSFATTGIGSLPHRDLKKTLDCAFATDLPCYPTLPARHPAEGMLAQTVQGFPGVEVVSFSQLRLHPKVWKQNREDFSEKLSEDFNRNRYHDWLPPAGSAWPDFLIRVTGHPGSWVKTQITGPLTLTQAIEGFEEESFEFRREILDTLTDLLIAKALAMAAEFRFRQKQTLLFIDEPGLSLSKIDAYALKKLAAMLQELKSYGIKLGLHCCGNADFKRLLELPIDYLSLDTALSISVLLKTPDALQNWFKKGGRLSLGVVPTRKTDDFDPASVAQSLQKTFLKIFRQAPSQAEKILAESLLTPACGLGLSSIDDTNWAFSMLSTVQAKLKRMLHDR